MVADGGVGGIAAAFNCAVRVVGVGGTTGCAIANAIFATLDALFFALWSRVCVCFVDKPVE